MRMRSIIKNRTISILDHSMQKVLMRLEGGNLFCGWLLIDEGPEAKYHKSMNYIKDIFPSFTCLLAEIDVLELCYSPL